MKKLIYILVFLFIFSTPVHAIQEMWSSNQDASWKANKAANNKYWTHMLTYAQYGSWGMRNSIRCAIGDGNFYCNGIYDDWSGIVENPSDWHYTNPDGIRETWIRAAIGYNMGNSIWTAGEVQYFRDFFEHHFKYALYDTTATHTIRGMRASDSDEAISYYFGAYMSALAIYDQDSVRALEVINWPNDCYPNDSASDNGFGGFGAYDSGTDGQTMREVVYNYFTDTIAGGDWLESTEYNYGTLMLILEGYNSVNTFCSNHAVCTGDQFPEITAWISNQSDYLIQALAPSMTDGWNWGDSQNPNGLYGFKVTAPYASICGLDQSADICWAFETLWDSYVAGGNVPDAIYWLLDERNTATKPSTVTSFDSNGKLGEMFWHEGWADSNETFFASQMKKNVGVDHDGSTMPNFSVWANGNWATSNPRAYWGQPQNHPYNMNTVRLNGVHPYIRQECKEEISGESGTNYLYHVGYAAGVAKINNSLWVGESVHEFFPHHLMIHNADDSNTVIQFYRLNTTDPRNVNNWGIVENSAGYGQQVVGNGGWYVGTDAKHEMTINYDDTLTSYGSGRWTAQGLNNNTFAFQTFSPAYASFDTGIYPYADGSIQSVPVNNGGLLRIRPTTLSGHMAFANIYHYPGTDSTSITEVTGSGEGIIAYKIKNGTDDVIAIFNGTDKTTDLGNITQSVWTGDQNLNRCAEGKALQFFAAQSEITLAIDRSTDIYITDLNPAVGYTFEYYNSGWISVPGFSSWANGVEKVTFTAVTGNTQFRLTSGEAPQDTCDTDCTLCDDAGECSGSALTCYFYNGACWPDPEADDCDDACNLCSTEVACEGSAQTCFWWGSDCRDSAPPSDNCFQKTLITVKDGHLWEDEPTANQESVDKIRSGAAVDGDYSGVAQFSLAQLPLDMTVTTIEFSGVLAAELGVGETVYIYEGLINDWVEDEITWNVYSTGNNWGTAGARNATDINGTWGTSTGAIATLEGTSQEAQTRVTFTANSAFNTLAEQKAGGELNLIFHSATDSSGVFNIHSKEIDNTSKHPELQIDYCTSEETGFEARKYIKGSGVMIGSF